MPRNDMVAPQSLLAKRSNLLITIILGKVFITISKKIFLSGLKLPVTIAQTYHTGKRYMPHPPPDVVEHDVFTLLLANTENIFSVSAP